MRTEYLSSINCKETIYMETSWEFQGFKTLEKGRCFMHLNIYFLHFFYLFNWPIQNIKLNSRLTLETICGMWSVEANVFTKVIGFNHRHLFSYGFGYTKRAQIFQLHHHRNCAFFLWHPDVLMESCSSSSPTRINIKYSIFASRVLLGAPSNYLNFQNWPLLKINKKSFLKCTQ